MTFLALVIGLLILRVHGPVRVLQNDAWFLMWIQRMERAAWLRHDGVRTLLVILVPVVLLALLLWVLREWSLLQFVIGLIVLLYSLGRGDLKTRLDDYRSAVQRGDTQAAYHELTPINRDSGATDWLELQQELVAGLPYRLFEREFAVVFWFAILGPAGALLYRLTWLRASQWVEPSAETGLRSAGAWPVPRLLTLLEWLPARLLIPSLAIVGNFTPVMQRAVRLCLGSYPAANLLAILVQAAAGWRSKDLEAGSDRDVIAVIEALMRRALVLWILVVAVWVLFT